MQGDGQILRALLGEVPGDLHLAPERRPRLLGGLGDRCRLDDAVEFDPDDFVEVALGHLVPGTRTRTGQREVDDPRARWAQLCRSALDRGSPELSGPLEVATCEARTLRPLLQDDRVGRVRDAAREGSQRGVGPNVVIDPVRSGRRARQVRADELIGSRARRREWPRRRRHAVARGVLCRDVRGCVTEHGAKVEPCCLTDRIEHFGRVLQPRDGDRDLVGSRGVHLCPRDPESVHPVVQDVDRLRQVRRRDGVLGPVHDGQASGEVEAEARRPFCRHDRRERTQRDNQDSNDAGEQVAPLSAALWAAVRRRRRRSYGHGSAPWFLRARSWPHVDRSSGQGCEGLVAANKPIVVLQRRRHAR